MNIVRDFISLISLALFFFRLFVPPKADHFDVMI